MAGPGACLAVAGLFVLDRGQVREQEAHARGREPERPSVAGCAGDGDGEQAEGGCCALLAQGRGQACSHKPAHGCMRVRSHRLLNMQV